MFSLRLSVCMSVCQSVCLSVGLSVCQTICLCSLSLSQGLVVRVFYITGLSFALLYIFYSKLRIFQVGHYTNVLPLVAKSC